MEFTDAFKQIIGRHALPETVLDLASEEGPEQGVQYLKRTIKNLTQVARWSAAYQASCYGAHDFATVTRASKKDKQLYLELGRRIITEFDASNSVNVLDDPRDEGTATAICAYALLGLGDIPVALIDEKWSSVQALLSDEQITELNSHFKVFMHWRSLVSTVTVQHAKLAPLLAKKSFSKHEKDRIINIVKSGVRFVQFGEEPYKYRPNNFESKECLDESTADALERIKSTMSEVTS